MPISILPDDMASFTDVEHYSRGGAGHSLDTLTRHEGYLSEIYSQGADDIMSAAKTSSQEEVLGAIKRTGQKWEVRTREEKTRQRERESRRRVGGRTTRAPSPKASVLFERERERETTESFLP